MIPYLWLLPAFAYGVITVCTMVYVLELTHRELRLRDVLVLCLVGWLILPVGGALEAWRWFADKW